MGVKIIIWNRQDVGAGSSLLLFFVNPGKLSKTKTKTQISNSTQETENSEQRYHAQSTEPSNVLKSC